MEACIVIFSVKRSTRRVPIDFFVGIFQKFKLLGLLVACFRPNVNFSQSQKEYPSGRVYRKILRLQMGSIEAF